MNIFVQKFKEQKFVRKRFRLKWIFAKSTPGSWTGCRTRLAWPSTAAGRRPEHPGEKEALDKWTTTLPLGAWSSGVVFDCRDIGREFESRLGSI
jgi:hypothetical protein